MIWTVKFAHLFGVHERDFPELDKVLWYPQVQVLSTKSKADADNSQYTNLCHCTKVHDGPNHVLYM